MPGIITSAKDKVLNIELPPKFNQELLANFDAESKSWLLSEAQLYVLDFNKLAEINPSDYRVLVSFCASVGKAQKKIVSINVGPAFVKQFKKDGIIDALSIYTGAKQDPKRKAM